MSRTIRFAFRPSLSAAAVLVLAIVPSSCSMNTRCGMASNSVSKSCRLVRTDSSARRRTTASPMVRPIDISSSVCSSALWPWALARFRAPTTVSPAAMGMEIKETTPYCWVMSGGN